MQVLRRQDEIKALGAEAIFVVHDRSEVVRNTLLYGLEVGFPVLVDRDRAAYRAWGLARGSRRRVWLDPRVWLAYARLIAGGERVRGLGEDTLQLGGDFVVGPDGRIVYSRPQERDDRPPVATLIQALARAAGGGSGEVAP